MFVTRYRRGVFDEEMLALYERVMREVCTDFSAEFTGKVNRARTQGHLWSPSYFAASCGGAPSEIVKEYILGQQRPS